MHNSLNSCGNVYISCSSADKINPISHHNFVKILKIKKRKENNDTVARTFTSLNSKRSRYNAENWTKENEIMLLYTDTQIYKRIVCKVLER